MQTGYLLIFNMQPLCHLLLVSSCIFKILFSPPLSQTEQTDTELIVKFDKAPYICIAGLFSSVCKLYFTGVIICHPILNLVKWTHKLQSLNLAQL